MMAMVKQIFLAFDNINKTLCHIANAMYDTIGTQNLTIVRLETYILLWERTIPPVDLKYNHSRLFSPRVS